ncbi:hypothetical protein KIH27_01250 [Mycobacterium sp. M1]|uniref:Uncharacterized protein n=1 Tax=Mycolicibacter acidiphilus TaxID=2835306 RepID=A0ABS5RD57_9MYCO|nr:hypothetical protein [Mycolicibacter acidiphilus]MBS9532210.1 hypothetical protein [Mycolicibacter acidiphilus]
MVWGIVLAVLLVLLVIGGLIAGVVNLIFPFGRAPASNTELAVILAISFFTLLLTVLMAELGGAWFVLPIAVGLTAVSIIRHSAPVLETDEQRRIRVAEEGRRAAARERVAARKRIDDFGKDGLSLIARAQRAVDGIMATEAARDGWLGDADDLDFSADLTMITGTLKQARRMEKLAAKSKAIPRPSDEDTSMVRDAERAVKHLRSAVKQRAQILDDCASQARHVDRTLAQEREDARLAERRDEARRQLAAELYGVEAAPPASHSDAADAVQAYVAAFRELKGVIDEQRRREITKTLDSD